MAGGQERLLGAVYPHLAFALLGSGQTRRALEVARLHLRHLAEGGDDPERGRGHLAVAVALAEGPPPDGSAAVLDELSRLAGLPPKPESWFERALELSGGEKPHPVQVRALHEYGRYLMRAGRPGPGEELIRKARSRAVELRAAGELAAAGD